MPGDYNGDETSEDSLNSGRSVERLLQQYVVLYESLDINDFECIHSTSVLSLVE